MNKTQCRGPHPLYPNNPEKQQKLNFLIQNGFIDVKQLGPNNFNYILNPFGLDLWMNDNVRA